VGRPAFAFGYGSASHQAVAMVAVRKHPRVAEAD